MAIHEITTRGKCSSWQVIFLLNPRADMKQVRGVNILTDVFLYLLSEADSRVSVFHCLAVSVGSDHCLIETIVLLSPLSKK